MSKAKKAIFATRNENAAEAFKRYLDFLDKENDENAYFDLYTPSYQSTFTSGINECIAQGSDDKKYSLANKDSAIFFIKESLNELIRLLEEQYYEDLSRVLIILDYASLYDDFKLFDGQNPTPLARLFICYPEATIWILKLGNKQLPLFKEIDEPIERYQYIVKNLEEVLEFGYHIESGRSMFDASGIRNYIKVKLREKMDFETDNFHALHESRRTHLALAVDEETRHSLFWAYSLYSFGYSVLPITTAGELNSLRKRFKNGEHKVDLICRDFDLQFPDLQAPTKDAEDPRKIPLYQYRGVIPLKDDAESFALCLENPKDENQDDENSFFWRALYDDERTKTVFVSQLPESNTLPKGQMGVIAGKRLIKRNELKYNETFNRYGLTVQDGKVILNGISKEVEGMFDFHRSDVIKQVYQESRSCTTISKKRGTVSGHSIPAVNSRIASSLIGRGKKEYKKERYLEAALLASEALEVLNGLSMSASMEAFHLKCCAEVKLELSVIGVGDFKKVARKRIYEIRRLLYRLTAENKEARRNAKMQIFNDLRKIYLEHEQFDASEIMYNEVVKAELGTRDVMRYNIRAHLKPIVPDTADQRKVRKRYIENWTDKAGCWLKYICHSGNSLVFLLFLLVLSSNYFLLQKQNFLFSQRVGVVFPWIYFIFFVVLLMWRRKKLLYLIIGAGTNFSKLFTTFFSFNLIMYLVYHLNFAKENFYSSSLAKTLITSLINEPYDLYSSCPRIETPDIFYVLMIIHVTISVFYLGVLISALYRWFVRR